MKCKIDYKITEIGVVPSVVEKAKEYIEALDNDGYLLLQYSEFANEFSAIYDACYGLTRKEIDNLTDKLIHL